MVQFLVGLKYKSSLEHDLVAAVPSLPLGDEFSGFLRYGFLHHSSTPGGRNSLQSKQSPIPAGTAQLYPTPVESLLSRMIKSLDIDRKSFRAAGKKKPSTFSLWKPMLVFPVVALVCVTWLSNFGEWGKTQMTSETHLHRNLLILCMNKFHSNDLEENINNMIMGHLHTLLNMLSIQTKEFVQSSLSANRETEQVTPRLTSTSNPPADVWKYWWQAWLFGKIFWVPDHSERQWDLGILKIFQTVQSLISLYFHFSSPDDFVHALAFPKHQKKYYQSVRHDKFTSVVLSLKST